MRFLERVEENLQAFEPAELRDQVIASWAREPEVSTAEEFDRLMRDQFPFHFADPMDPRIDEYLDRTADTVYQPDVLRHFAASGYGGIEVEDRLGAVRHRCSCWPDGTIGRASWKRPRRSPRVCATAGWWSSSAAGHMTFVEEQDRYIARVAAFLGEVTDPP